MWVCHALLLRLRNPYSYKRHVEFSPIVLAGDMGDSEVPRRAGDEMAVASTAHSMMPISCSGNGVDEGNAYVHNPAP